jgi:hypothetical protein
VSKKLCILSSLSLKNLLTVLKCGLGLGLGLGIRTRALGWCIVSKEGSVSLVTLFQEFTNGFEMWVFGVS